MKELYSNPHTLVFLNDMRGKIKLMQQIKLVKSGKQIIKSGKIY